MAQKYKPHLLLDVCTSLLLLTICYRIFFSIDNNFSTFNSQQYGSLFLGCISDLIVIGGLAASFFVVGKFAARITKKTAMLACVLCYSGIVFSYLLIFFIAILYVAHKKIFFTLYTGLTYTLFISSFQEGFSLNNYSSFVDFKDCIFIFLSGVILTSVRLISKNSLLTLNAYILLPVTLFFILSGLLCFVFCSYRFEERNIALYSNPLSYIVSEQIHNFLDPYYWRKDLPSTEQIQSIALIDSSFVNKTIINQHIQKKAIIASPIPWNIVLIILESTGSTHIFEKNSHHPTSMPFLQSLTKRGLWLNNNYSTGNTSLLGGFGILTGLYASPSASFFSARRDTIVPVIANFLDKKYEKIFVIASASQYYFPEHLVKNGFNHFYDARTIPHTPDSLLQKLYLREELSTGFFISSLAKAKSPFIATYWSSAAHFPYFDYGKKYEIITKNLNNPLSRYVNNLNLLDQQIKRIYQALEKNDLLNNTILVIVGDHGENFGEHVAPGSWIHGSALYQEQIKVPLLFFQPRIFKPRTINQITSSADIVPTLLDAMNVSYNSQLVQGESVLKPIQKRKYVFVYGQENEIAAIDQHNIKMQISFSKNNCQVYDLNRDPYERQLFHCQKNEQEGAIIKFHNFQPVVLDQYNRRLLASVGDTKSNLFSR